MAENNTNQLCEGHGILKEDQLSDESIDIKYEPLQDELESETLFKDDNQGSNSKVNFISYF